MDIVQRKYGFTLVEILVVLTIIAILASVAYPNYKQFQFKANRAAAQQFLLRASSVQHQYFVANNGRAFASEQVLFGGFDESCTPSANGLVKASAKVCSVYGFRSTAASGQLSWILAWPRDNVQANRLMISTDGRIGSDCTWSAGTDLVTCSSDAW